MIIGVRELRDEVEKLERVVAEQQQALEERDERIRERDERIRKLEHRVEVLTRVAFAPKSERRPRTDIDPNLLQGHLLFPELIEAAERVADEKRVHGTVEVRSTGSRKKPKRRKHFPPHLPVFRTTFELDEDDRRCSCGDAMHSIGEEVSRELERLEISAVHEIARVKYACKQCQQGVLIAPGPDRVIDKGILGVGFLAHLLVERFGYHMPYNRLETKYAAEGFDLSRSVLCESSLSCAEILAPIADQILVDALASGVVQTDDTSVVIQEGSHKRSRKGHVWVYRGLGGQVFFDVTESRSRDGPAKVFEGYEGFIQADAYSAYDAFFRPEGPIEVGCMAHARRYFIDAESSDPKLAAEAIERIGELYAIERQIKDLSVEERAAVRRRESAPRLERLHDWMDVAFTKVLDKSPLGQAIKYARNNWKALTRYVEDGRLSIDNNAAERALRTVAVGRKNWIFFGNKRGGDAAAVMYSLIATCKEHDVDPRLYLRDVLLRIGKVSDVRELTPYGWKQRWADSLRDHRLSVLERLLELAKG